MHFKLLMFLYAKIMNFYITTYFCANYTIIPIKKKPIGIFISLILKNYIK